VDLTKVDPARVDRAGGLIDADYAAELIADALAATDLQRRVRRLERIARLRCSWMPIRPRNRCR